MRRDHVTGARAAGYRMRSALLVLVLLAGTTRLEAQEPGAARTPQTATGQIEALLRDGWEVVSFVAASDIRTLVLLRHKQATWLVQCSVLIDVTRQPTPIVRCYEIR